MKLSRRDFLKIGAATGAAAGGIGLLGGISRRKLDKTQWAGKASADIHRIPGMCQACTNGCGIIGLVKDGRLLNVIGNPEDPSNEGAVCAKGAAGAATLYDPYRPLYPLRRVGPRGAGQWKRISWDEALDEIADKLRAIRESGRPEEFAFQQGRNRSGDAVGRFLRSFGTHSHWTHRAICSNGRRIGNISIVGSTQWDVGDYANSRYILNFGSNWAEAHQGGLPMAIRMMRGRESGAKIVTFEARLSNTAALSDERFFVKPGTDGLIALAMGNVICSEGLWNKAFFDTWSNYPAEEYAEHVKQYTPELAEKESGVPADEIRRIAREFAAAAPRCTTVSNRGASAHWNGFYNERAIIMLNALVGSIGEFGGFTWPVRGSYDGSVFKQPEPIPPAPTRKSAITQAKDWPLASLYMEMRVGQINYLWMKERKQRVQALFTYNADPSYNWPEPQVAEEVYRDEELLPFHVVLDYTYSGTAHLADIVLPWTTYLEKWDIDARPGFIGEYVGLRQPIVQPLGESRDIREIFPELARRIGGGMEQYYPWKDTEEYLAHMFQAVPGGLEYMKKHGAYRTTDKLNYRPHMEELSAEELEGTTVDPDTQIVYKGEDEESREAIGIVIDGVARRGFRTPSRKLEVYNEQIVESGKTANREINPLPIYDPIPTHQHLEDDQLIMISFKWNVHNAHRTQGNKWLQEIVHTNPAWLNPATARRLGIRDGDWIEVTSYRPKDMGVPNDDGSELGTVRIPVVLTEGIHPKTLAISHNAGRFTGGPYATNEDMPKDHPALAGIDDADVKNVWWHGKPSVHQNPILPIYPERATGQQSFNDTVVRIRKV